MKITISILALVMAISSSAYSQTVFNRAYNDFSYFYERPDSFSFYRNDDYETLEILQGQYFLVCGATQNITLLGDTSGFKHQFFYSFINYNNGDTLWNKHLELYSGADFVADIYSYQNNSLVFFGSSDTIPNNNRNGVATMIFLDSLGNYQRHYEYRFGNRTQFWGAKTQDNGQTFDVIGRVDTGTLDFNYVNFLVKIDSSGNILQEFYGMDYGQLEFFYDLEYAEDSAIYIGGIVPIVNASGTVSDYYLIKLDKNYNLLWEFIYDNGGYEIIGTEESLIYEPDGLVFCGWSGTNNDDIKARISKLDFNGNFIWEYASEEKRVFNGYKVIRKTNDGHYVAAGETGDPDFTNNHKSRALLTKVSNTGELMWTRIISKYWGTNSYDYVYDMNIALDGGLLLAGYQISSGIQTNGIFHRNDGWLCKTDSCGFTTGAQPQALLTVDSVIGPTVYISNLSDEYCTALLDFSIYDSSTGDTIVFDSLDIYAYSQFTNGNDPTQIQYTFTDTGDYDLTLYTYAGDGIDTFTTQVQVKDTMTSINSVMLSLTGHLNIYPNPAKDYIILQADFGKRQLAVDGFGANNKIIGEIYTITGQKVYDFNINTKLLQQKIALPDLDNGVYLLKISTQNYHIATKRISIVK